MGSAGKSLIAQNYVDQKGIVSNKNSYPNEHSQVIIDSLSVSAASIFPAIPVALGKLEQASVTLLKGVTPKNKSLKTAAATGFLAYVV